MALKSEFDRIVCILGAHAANGHPCWIEPDPEDRSRRGGLYLDISRSRDALKRSRHLRRHPIKRVQIASEYADQDCSRFPRQRFADPVAKEGQRLALDRRIGVKRRTDLFLRGIFASRADGLLEIDMELAEFGSVGLVCGFLC